MTVKLDGYDGPEVIKIQIGSIYKGSSTRDTLTIIDFGNYTNQEEWAAISQELHTMIDENVVQPADPASLEGKTIDFVGTFTVDGNDELLITAVKLDVE
jgi:predicted lipoprotein